MRRSIREGREGAVHQVGCPGDLDHLIPVSGAHIAVGVGKGAVCRDECDAVGNGAGVSTGEAGDLVALGESVSCDGAAKPRGTAKDECASHEQMVARVGAGCGAWRCVELSPDSRNAPTVSPIHRLRQTPCPCQWSGVESFVCSKMAHQGAATVHSALRSPRIH